MDTRTAAWAEIPDTFLVIMLTSIDLVSCMFGKCLEFLQVCNFLAYRGPNSVCARQTKDAVEYHAGLNWQMPDPNTFYYCRHRSMIKVIHKPDPSLTVRLSKVCYYMCIHTHTHTQFNGHFSCALLC